MMSDMACIYEMNMIDENEQMENDILSGIGMDVMLCLMDGISTGREIAGRIGVPNYSVQLYLQRFVKAGLVREDKEIIQNGQIEKQYALISDEIEIMNRIRGTEIERRRKVELSGQHFAYLTKKAIKNVNTDSSKPHKIKSYFMKAKKSDMEKFKQEIDELFEKYQALEDLDEDETYSLFTILAPYGKGENENEDIKI